MRIWNSVEFSDREREVFDRAVLGTGVGFDDEDLREGAKRALRVLVQEVGAISYRQIAKGLLAVKLSLDSVLRESTFDYWKTQAGDDWENAQVQRLAEVIIESRQAFLVDLLEARSILEAAAKTTESHGPHIPLVAEDVPGEDEYEGSFEGDYRSDVRREDGKDDEISLLSSEQRKASRKAERKEAEA